MTVDPVTAIMSGVLIALSLALWLLVMWTNGEIREKDEEIQKLRRDNDRANRIP